MLKWRLAAIGVGIVIGLGAGSVRAGDGVIEINQTSVMASGGFPFYATSGSFVLTGNLTVPDAGKTAIVLGPGASLDLNGFTIAGPNLCSRPNTYDPSTMTCTAPGLGVGVSAGSGGLVSNGRITGMGRVGIAGGTVEASLRIENVQIDNNAQGGVDLYAGVLRNSSVNNNGGPGVFDCSCGASGSGTIVEGNVISFNKGDGVGVAALIAGNRISYNGGAGIKHTNAGGSRSRINDNFIYRNVGVGIDAFGSYAGNGLFANGTSGGSQVIGGMADAGGNSTN